MTIDETWIHHFTLEWNWQISWVDNSRWKLSKAAKGANINRQCLAVFWDVQGILFINYLEKEKTINSEYYIALLVCLKEEIVKKQLQMKKTIVTKTMYCVTSWSQQMQNHMNCTLNCFPIHPILQIWPPATTNSRERDLAPMKKWYWKLRRILRPKTNCSTKKASNYQRSVGISVSL